MKEYSAKRKVNLSADRAFQALKQMDRWLVNLDTITKVEYEAEPFFYEGRIYQVHTPEQVVMKAEIVEANEEKRYIRIHVKASILRSQLYCGVEEVDGSHCYLIRKQAYPGFVGWLFTKCFNKREAEETEAYLKAWEAHGIQMK